MNGPNIVQEWKDPFVRQNPDQTHPAGVMMLEIPVLGSLTISTPSHCTMHLPGRWDG